VIKIAYKRQLALAAMISAVGLLTAAAPAQATTPWTPTSTCATDVIDIPSPLVNNVLPYDSSPYGLSGSAGSYTIPSSATGVRVSDAASICSGTPLNFYGGDANTDTIRTAYFKFPAQSTGISYFDEANIFHYSMTGTPGAFGWAIYVLDPSTAARVGSPRGTSFQWRTAGQPSSGEYTLDIAVSGITAASRSAINAAGPIIVVGLLGNTGALAHLTDNDQIKSLTVNRYGHTVAFDSNGGAGSMTSQVGTVSSALTTNVFSRSGYTFAGWSTSASGGGTTYNDGDAYDFAAADVTLYAQWISDSAASSSSSANSLASTGFNGSGYALVGSELVLLGALFLTLRKLMQLARVRKNH
jgi:uncharacterized repeat protein (TIGR02543 family)